MGASLHGLILAIVGGLTLSLTLAQSALAQIGPSPAGPSLAGPLPTVPSPAGALQTGSLRNLARAADSGVQASPEKEEAVVHSSAKILPAEGQQPARLQVTAKIKDGWHIYSITQKPGGPVKTKIKVPESTQYKVGEFKAITPPVSHPEPDFDNLVVEEHSGEAVWEAPLTLTGGATDLKISGAVNAQACSNACLPPTDYKFETAASAGKKRLLVNP